MALPLRSHRPTRLQTDERPRSNAATFMKTAGLVSLAILFWINGREDEYRASNAAVDLPRKLETSAIPLMQRDVQSSGASAISIVTFVDERKADAVKTTGATRKKAWTQKTLQEWRTTYLQSCNNDNVDGEEILDMAKSAIRPPAPSTGRKVESTFAIEPCQYTFLDLGANVGDSLSKFIDSGWDNCRKPDGFIFSPKYNLQEGIIDRFHASDNVLVQFSRHVMRKGGRNGPPLFPEQFCYYGLEGNPIFTPGLKALQDRVMNSTPRLVQKAHFFTETVAAGADGPTVLYLDTISADKNYWGSSVLTQPKYVRESAERHNKGKPIEAQVQGTTLSTLVERTTRREEGSFLMIKVDIEGGEFALFQEVHQSGVLCDFAARGVTVHILVEKHAPQFEAAGLSMALWDKFMHDLTKCGVHIQGGMNAGR